MYAVLLIYAGEVCVCVCVCVCACGVCVCVCECVCVCVCLHFTALETVIYSTRNAEPTAPKTTAPSKVRALGFATSHPKSPGNAYRAFRGVSHWLRSGARSLQPWQHPAVCSCDLRSGGRGRGHRGATHGPCRHGGRDRGYDVRPCTKTERGSKTNGALGLETPT